MIQPTLSVVGTWIEHDKYVNFAYTKNFWILNMSPLSHQPMPFSWTNCLQPVQNEHVELDPKNRTKWIIYDHQKSWYNVRLFLCPNSPLPKTQHRTAQTLSTKQWREVRQPGHAPQWVPGLWDFPFFDGKCRHIMAYKFWILDKIR